MPHLQIRHATPDDAAPCGQICYNAFEAINTAHGFPNDFPNPNVTTGLLSHLFASPHHFSIVAELDGRIVGSNCLDEQAIIRGVGPITIDPTIQNTGIGRQLMQAVLERAREQSAPGIRLVQTGFHNRSLALYASLGFDIREPLSCVQGRTTERTLPGYTVRPATPEDEPACNDLALRIHGFTRDVELAQSIAQGNARVVERLGRITGYSSHLAFFGHSTAETNPDLQALIASADIIPGPGLLIPSRNTALLRWCLSNGLRIMRPLTLMSLGLYNNPTGAWLPSILF